MRGVPHSEDGKKPSPGMGHLSGDGFSLASGEPKNI